MDKLDEYIEQAKKLPIADLVVLAAQFLKHKAVHSAISLKSYHKRKKI